MEDAPSQHEHAAARACVQAQHTWHGAQHTHSLNFLSVLYLRMGSRMAATSTAMPPEMMAEIHADLPLVQLESFSASVLAAPCTVRQRRGWASCACRPERQQHTRSAHRCPGSGVLQACACAPW